MTNGLCARARGLRRAKHKGGSVVCSVRSSSGVGSVAGELEARLVDVPFPVGSVVSPLEHCETNVLSSGRDAVAARFVYSGSPEEVMGFYSREMERLGWRKLFVFAGDESLMNFEKPGRLCSFAIKDESKKKVSRCRVSVFTGAVYSKT